jgi:hypothetical protein
VTDQPASVGDLAGQVILTDVASEQLIASWSKGTWIDTGAVPYVPQWWQPGPGTTDTPRNWWVTLITIVVIILTGGSGIATGVFLFGPGTPAEPSFVAAGPTPTPSPVTATPVLSTPTPGPITATPVVSTPTPGPLTATPVLSTPTPGPITATPVVSTPTPSEVPEVATPLDPLAELIGLDFLLDLTDELTDPGTPDPAEEPRDSPASANLTGLQLAHANLSRGDLAAVGGWVGQRTAVIQDMFPCTDVHVFCGPQTLKPGGYYFVGFSLKGPPPTSGTDRVYMDYYLLTDLDGDLTNNGVVTPPQTNNIFAATQYLIEGGWYGTGRGLGETDFQGPVGPDGQTTRYNQAPASRLVLSEDPAGGFFIVPDDRMGDWFRLASFWQDLNQQGMIAIDWISATPTQGLVPVPGRASPPVVLACGRVDISDPAPDGELAQLVIQLRLKDPVSLGAGSSLELTLMAGQDEVDRPGLALEQLADGTWRARVGVAVDSSYAFKRLLLTSASGQSLDVTDEFIALTGSAGVGVQAGVSGYAMGDPTCGSEP